MRWFIVLLLILTAVSVSQAQTAVPPPDIEIDVTSLFDRVNAFIPTFLDIFAIPAGIVLAIALVRMIILTIGNAFTVRDFFEGIEYRLTGDTRSAKRYRKETDKDLFNF